ncbi:hypothetical protein ACIF8T_26055 [Streptomyces sp. NPDC085946]|uniref:hypothetical protein n=1 Tax=Streptomyces sp. NPDC085946 TaxID=3365744 RepID=UPI0037D8513B
MTVRQTRSATPKQLLDQALAELINTVDRRDAVGSAIIAAVEGATLMAGAAEEAGLENGGGKAVELAQEALGAMRASVIATTVSVRALADRRRERALAESAERDRTRQLTG